MKTEKRLGLVAEAGVCEGAESGPTTAPREYQSPVQPGFESQGSLVLHPIDGRYNAMRRWVTARAQ